MALDTSELHDLLLIDPSLDQRDLCKQGHHRRRWGCCQAFVAWELLGRRAQGQPNLSLENTGDEQAQHRAHRSGRDPFGLLPPHVAERCWLLEPAKAGFHRGVLLLIDLENGGIRTRLSAHGRGQDGPPIVLFSVAQGFDLDCQAITRLRRWWGCLRWTSAPSPARAAGVCHHARV